MAQRVKPLLQEHEELSSEPQAWQSTPGTPEQRQVDPGTSLVRLSSWNTKPHLQCEAFFWKISGAIEKHTHHQPLISMRNSLVYVPVHTHAHTCTHRAISEVKIKPEWRIVMTRCWEVEGWLKVDHVCRTRVLSYHTKYIHIYVSIHVYVIAT